MNRTPWIASAWMLLLSAPAALAQDTTEPPPGTVAFESFSVRGTLELPHDQGLLGSLSLRAQFALGELSDGIFPGDEDITLVIEPEPPQTNIPEPPCNIVALPAGSLVAFKDGWKLDEEASGKLQFFLLFPDNTTVDLTPFVTDVGVRLAQSPTDKSWELKLQIDLAGLQSAFFPQPPCNIVATVGNDGGTTHVAAKMDFHSVD